MQNSYTMDGNFLEIVSEETKVLIPIENVKIVSLHTAMSVHQVNIYTSTSDSDAPYSIICNSAHAANVIYDGIKHHWKKIRGQQ